MSDIIRPKLSLSDRPKPPGQAVRPLRDRAPAISPKSARFSSVDAQLKAAFAEIDRTP